MTTKPTKFKKHTATVPEPSACFTGVITGMRDGDLEFALFAPNKRDLAKVWGRLWLGELDSSRVQSVAYFEEHRLKGKKRIQVGKS